MREERGQQVLPHSGSAQRPAPAPASPQVPIHALWNDGRENLLGALLLAGQYVIPEVPPPPAGGAGSGVQRGVGAGACPGGRR